MIKRFLGLLAFSLLLWPANARASADEIVKETLVSQGKKRAYYLFAPASIKTSTPVPLIVTLHGSGRNGLTLVEKWKELASREKIVIAGPDALNSRGWQIPQDGPDFLHELIEALKARYPIDARRVYLFGHSAGAVFALNLSMLESEYFAAAAMHAGSWRDEKDFALIEYASRKIPLAIFVGDRDDFFPLNWVKATNDALKAQGFPLEVTVLKGHTHWYYDLAPKINRDAWEFLRKHQLTDEPRYVAFTTAGAADEVNRLLTEVNLIKNKANERLARLHLKEAELKSKNFDRDREEIRRIAREELALINEGATALREAAAKVEQAGRLNLPDNYRRYLSLVAQIERKRAEALEALREQAEALLGGGSFETVDAKRTEARARAEVLHREVDELERKAEEIRPKE